MKIQGVGATPSYSEVQVNKPEAAPVQEAIQVKPVKPAATQSPKKESSASPDEGKHLDDEIIQKSVEQANQSLKAYNRYIQRDVHETTHAIMYKIKDSKTDEVIAEFPPKKIQDMIAKMWEIAGLFVDEKA